MKHSHIVCPHTGPYKYYTSPIGLTGYKHSSLFCECIKEEVAVLAMDPIISGTYSHLFLDALAK
jgi:hypothetical protein